MDYKEKYEKALEFVTAIYRDGNYTVLKTITTTFPELEDIRNKKIRSALIRLVKQSTEELDESTQEEMLDWLDAQNKKKTDPRYKYLEDLIVADDIHQMSMNDEMVKEAKDKAIAALSKIGVCELLGFEKQCEQDSPVDINKMVDEFAHAESKGYGVPSMIEVDAYRKGIEDVLEKQGEQNFDYEHADIPQKDFAPIEPKFKEQDWIIHQGTGNIYQVVAIIDNQYQLKYGDNYTVQNCADVDGGARLYDVAKDAKDGDVLVASDGSIFLFAGVDDCACKYYVALTTDNYIKINKDSKGGYWETSRAVYPATKEQRDLLFQKMTDAGYEWDSKNKELKKNLLNNLNE